VEVLDRTFDEEARAKLQEWKQRARAVLQKDLDRINVKIDELEELVVMRPEVADYGEFMSYRQRRADLEDALEDYR
jgi:translation initiation factor 2 alpha subunit (eIF-2alpha)